MCAPPIARMRFTARSPRIVDHLKRFETEALICLGLGALRSYLNQSAWLGDFMGGGTDLFSAGLALCATFDCWSMNGSFLVMFLVWALTNAVLFDLVLSLGGNLANPSFVWSGGDSWRRVSFLADALLIIVNAALQLWMSWRAREMLDEALPNWRNQMAWGEDGGPSAAAAQQPLLGRYATTASAGQPPRSDFHAFSGAAQRLGGGESANNTSDLRRM